MTTAEALRAVTYRRVSSLDQVGGTSPETQLERGLKLISEQAWKHVGDFYDPGVSGPRDRARTLIDCSPSAAPAWPMSCSWAT